MPAPLDLRRGQVVGDASRRAVNLNTVSRAQASATFAPIASPTFTGDPKAPTPAPGDNDTSVATTAFVGAAISASPNQTITLSGDISGSGTAGITTTLPNVNANVGTWNNVTINAKGLATAGSNVAYLTSSGVSGLTAGQLTVAGSATTITSSIANGQLPATATNDNAAAGKLGEYVESNLASGSAVSLTTNTPRNVTSISLTAGDWDVTGNVLFILGGTTVCVGFYGAMSITSATFPDASRYMEWQGSVTGLNMGWPVPQQRISVASTTTVYLLAQASFGTSTLTVCGTISARRAR